MLIRLLAVLFAILIGFSNSAKIEVEKPTGQCVDNTLYKKYLCKDKASETKWLVPGKCHQYYECINQEAVEKSCGKLFFDSVKATCVKKSDCVEVDDTTCNIPTPPPCTCPPPPPPPPQCQPSPGPCNNQFDPNDLYGSYVCRNKIDGTMLIDPKSCNKFYLCVHGHSIHRSCGENMYYNPKQKACDKKENVFCPMQM